MSNFATPASTKNSIDSAKIDNALPAPAATLVLPPAASIATSKYTEQAVVSIHRWNEALMSLRINRDAAYGFVPGQFARIGLKKEDGEIIWRAYSIVSAPHEAFLEFFLVVVPSGEFSSRVAKLTIGDTMLVEKHAQGFLTADRFKDGRDLWLLATGTGLAPYISMVRDRALWQQFENIVIVLSVRESSDLGYTEELAFLANQSPRAGGAKLRFVTTLTRENVNESVNESVKDSPVLFGRINALVESGNLEQAAALPLVDEHSRFMLCGNPDMVESMRALLKSRGFRMNRRLEPGHILVENYW